MQEENNQSTEQTPLVVPVGPPDTVSTNPFFVAQPEAAPAPVVTSAEAAPVIPSIPPQKQRSKKKLVIIIGATIAVILAAFALWFFLAGPGSESALDREFRKNSAYVYKDAQIDVDTKEKFQFDHTITPKDGKSFQVYEAKDYMNVFSDAALTQEANAQVSIIDKSIIISPTNYVGAEDPVAEEEIRISNDREWGLNDTYFIAQYVDLKSGEKLEKPIVRPFSTKKEIQTPIVSFKVNEVGTPSFTWSEIEGASSYYIVKLSDGYSLNTILGQTDETSWTYEQDKTGYFDPQNKDFFTGSYADDDLLDENSKLDAQTELLEGDSDANYGVIAVTDDARYSSIGLIDTDAILAQLPYREATNAKKNMGLPVGNSAEIDSLDKIPTHMPVVLADKSTVMKSVFIDTEKVEKSDKTIIVVGQGYITTLNIPYKIDGTALEGKFILRQFNDGTYKADISKIAARNVEEQNRGGLVAMGVIAERPNLDNVKISKTKPSVPYDINATNPFTEYLAANMLNGEEFIDVSAYVNNPSNPVSLSDALTEATYQNPYLVFEPTATGKGSGATYIADKKILAIQYGQAPEGLRKEIKTIDDEVKRVVASIIKPGMSDTDKARAINNYIIDRTEYNFAAANEIKKGDGLSVEFRNVSSPAGPLLDKLAVCSGYADAFKVLADEAGMESVVVSGTANSGPHAWNKVKIDGKWRMIDPTWNDAFQDGRYFLLTDAEANKLRVNIEGKDWVNPALVSRYAAV